MRVVIFNLNNPEIKVTIEKAVDATDAKRIMSLFCKGNSGWKIDRRPNLNTWDDVALTYVKD